MQQSDPQGHASLGRGVVDVQHWGVVMVMVMVVVMVIVMVVVVVMVIVSGSW